MEALVTPSVLRWARIQSGLGIRDVANKIKRSIEEIDAWENGVLKPSVPQARKLSEIYRRPLAVFYLPEPPKDFETLRDYRRLPEEDARSLSPALYETIRAAIEHQQWTKDFLIEEDMPKLSFAGACTLESLTSTVANQILDTFEITPAEQCKQRSRDDALRFWIKRVESKGVFVFRKGGIDPKECRGFVITDDIAPFIYINSEDAYSAQLFTLIHELAHIWIGSSGVSNLGAFGHYQSPDIRDVEQFCNQVAALTLLDADLFDKEWERSVSNSVFEDRILTISNIFKVSEEVVARRLLEKKIISHEKYRELRYYYQERWKELKILEKKKLKEQEGGPSYYVKTLMNNGHAFSRTVLGAYAGGKISCRDASSLLNVKVNNLSNLASRAGIRVPSSLGK